MQHDDCNSGLSCVSDVCNAGHCSHFVQEDCCANFVCDDGEDVAQCSDCELSTLNTAACTTDCTEPKGVMFDLTSNQDIIIESLTIQLYSGTNNIVVYTGLAYGN